MTTPSKTVGQAPGDASQAIFGCARSIVIGVVHLAPLPGSPRHDGEAVEVIYRRGLDDAHAYLSGGCDGVIVENHGDILTVADGAIVASSLKYDGVWWNEVDPDRVKRFTAGLVR